MQIQRSVSLGPCLCWGRVVSDAASSWRALGQSPPLLPEAPTQAFPTKHLLWIERTFQFCSKAYGVQRACSCRAAGSPLLPEVGVSHGKLQNPWSCRQRCPQHDTKNTTQRERSRTAVRTLRVYLTRRRSEDLIFGETGHQAAADGSCAHGGQPLRSTFALGLLHIHGQGRVCSNPTGSSRVLHRQRSSLCPHWEPGLLPTKESIG